MAKQQIDWGEVWPFLLISGVSVYFSGYAAAIFCLVIFAWASGQPKGSGQWQTNSSGLFPIFAFFWSFAVIAHQAYLGQFGYLLLTDVALGIRLPLDLVLNVAAVWALLKPGSVKRFLILIVIQLVAFAVHSPRPTNHWVFLSIANLSIVIAALALVRGSSAPLTGHRLFLAFAPALRASLIALYVFAAVAKMNWSYLDPEWSCATSLTKRTGLVPEGPIWDVPAIYGSIAVECAIPVLLLFRRMRPFALLLGWIFHLQIGIFRHHDFSAAMLASYVVFVDADIPRRIWSYLERSPRARSLLLRIAQLATHRATFPVLGSLVVVVALAGRFYVPIRDPVALMLKLTWLVIATSTGIAYALALRAQRAAEQEHVVEKVPGRTLAFAPLALLILVGLSPYLGLRTDSSFTMFSNLQTEADQWNHVFVPASLRVFDFQTDLVRIVDSSNPEFQKLASREDRLVYFSFRKLMQGQIRRSQRGGDDFSIQYEYRGQVERIEHAAARPELWEPESWLQSRVLKFRVVPPSDRNRCLH